MTHFDCPSLTGQLLREDLIGAPFNLGTLVDVLDCGDDSADERFSGRRGIVTGLLYDDPKAQAPHSPLVLVMVEGLGEELFFPDELKRVARQVNAVRAMLVA